MTPVELFIAKWHKGGDERRDAQPFFEELCKLVGHETPREADPNHTWFMYEAGADKTTAVTDGLTFGFHPEITDICKRVENFKSCLAVLRRILGLWRRSMVSNTSALAASSVG